MKKIPVTAMAAALAAAALLLAGTASADESGPAPDNNISVPI